jgi:hypothetical protein
MSEFPGYIPGFDDPADLFAKTEPSRAVPAHEHVWFSSLAALFLYFAGSLAVVTAILLIVAPDTLGNAQSAIGTCAGSFGALLRSIGQIFGAK